MGSDRPNERAWSSVERHGAASTSTNRHDGDSMCRSARAPEVGQVVIAIEPVALWGPANHPGRHETLSMLSQAQHFRCHQSAKNLSNSGPVSPDPLRLS
jgi:hypothetical protein